MSATLRVIRPLQKSVVNPLVKLAFRLGVPPPGDGLIETIGRRTGKPRLTPVCDCLVGSSFWVIAEQGRQSDYVRNLEANPRVRVKVRGGWRSGTAHILDDDDPYARRRILSRGKPARALCLRASEVLGTHLLTVRIDLDPEEMPT